MKNDLTSTIPIRTLVSDIRKGCEVDATTKKLLERLRELEQRDWAIRQEISAIHTALKIADVKPPASNRMPKIDEHESTYAIRRPFTSSTLSDACHQILKDYKSEWLSKSQIEYLVNRGGFKFTASDPKNSVDITLRRLAESGLIDVERVRGPAGNKYKCRNQEKPEEVKAQ